MNKELLQQVLDAAVSTLEGLGYTYHGGEQWQPPTRAAIAQPEQTANKCVCARHNGFCVCAFKTAKVEPAQPESKADKRQPLTDSHLCVLLLDIDPETKRLPPGFKAFARAIEAAHGIKA